MNKKWEARKRLSLAQRKAKSKRTTKSKIKVQIHNLPKKLG
jgi:hypothetical protein